VGARAWSASAVLGVRNVRQAAEYYRDVLGFDLDPDGVYVGNHADLERKGADIRQGPQLAPYGIREIEVQDLNGYRLTSGGYDPTSGT
jgi:catechol 2,3-dioxygenase-like lactoylglutathione lyase family enzyme